MSCVHSMVIIKGTILLIILLRFFLNYCEIIVEIIIVIIIINLLYLHILFILFIIIECIVDKILIKSCRTYIDKLII